MAYSIAPKHIQDDISAWIEKDNLWYVAQTLAVARDVLIRIQKGQRIRTATLEYVKKRLDETNPNSTTVQHSTEPVQRRAPRHARDPMKNTTVEHTRLTTTFGDALRRKVVPKGPENQ